MKKANKILEDAGITVNEQKLSKDEIDFTRDEMIDFTRDEMRVATSNNFLKYAKKTLYKDMKASVGDNSLDSPEAKKYINIAIKGMAKLINTFNV